MGNSNVIIYNNKNLIQCCNLINFQKSNEFDFKGGNSVHLNEKFRKRNNKLINNKPKINMITIDKNILLEMESQNKIYKKSIIITPWGIEGSSKIINYEEGSSIYFGEDSIINQVSNNNIIFYFVVIG